MSYSQVLRQKRAAKINEGKAIFDQAKAENRNLTAEESASINAIDKEIEAIEANLELADRQAARERAMASDVPVRQGAAGDGGRLADPSTDFRGFGDFLQAVAVSSRQGAKVDPRLLDINASGTGLSEGVPSDGGFLIRPDMATDLLMKTYAQGEVLSRLRKIPLSEFTNSIKINAVKENSRANGSRWGGVQAFWADEGGTVNATKPAFRQIELNLRKLIGLAYATDELLVDTAALGGVISQAFASEMVFKVEDAVINGDGVGKPLGIMNGGSMITQAIESTQTIANSPQFLPFNVSKMMARLFAPSMKNAVWLIQQDLIPYLALMTLGGTAAAMPVYLPPGGLSSAPYGTILGRPIVVIEQAQAVGTPGDLILADLSQYLITDRQQGVQSASSVHVRFLYDEMVFRFTYRVDGTPAWNSPLTAFKGANALSPFVNLNTRS